MIVSQFSKTIELKRVFSKDETQMAKKHFRSYTTLVIGEMQIDFILPQLT